MVRFTLPGILSTALFTLSPQPAVATQWCIGATVRVQEFGPPPALSQPVCPMLGPDLFSCDYVGVDLKTIGAVSAYVCSPKP